MAAGMVGSSILSNIAKPLMNSAADTMAHGFCEATGLCNTEQAEMFAQDLKSIGDDFLRPSSFMPSFFGDTISQRPGPKGLRAATSQNSANIPVEEPREHSILEFLKRPQYCGVVTNNTTQVVNNDVFAPFNSTPLNSWFAYFGQCARYFTGSINVHLQVCGHPMIETELTIARGYYQGNIPTNTLNILYFPSLFQSKVNAILCILWNVPITNKEPV